MSDSGEWSDGGGHWWEASYEGEWSRGHMMGKGPMVWGLMREGSGGGASIYLGKCGMSH